MKVKCDIIGVPPHSSAPSPSRGEGETNTDICSPSPIAMGIAER
jgi:hypothetical protein